MGTTSEAIAPLRQYHSTKPAVKAHIILVLLTMVLPNIVHIPTNFNIVVTAALAVFAGSWRSVKPEPSSEAMTKHDAMRFPIVGSCVLFGLFLAFKFLPAALVNALLAAYLGFLGMLVLTGAITPYFQDLFPASLRDKTFTLPPFKIPHVIDCTGDDQLSATVPYLSFGVVSAAFCVWYYTKKHWLANNALGLAFSLEGIEHLSLGSVHVGCILLVGLFFYDIFWVFCTPVMVSVAKNFDAPIKLLFPRSGALDATGKRPFSMLGLGDIVIPGIFVALILRHDVHRNFRSKYFQSAFGGYVLGLVATIVVMNVFNAAQPALLYIVPCVLGCVGLHAWVAGEFWQVFNWSEEAEAAVAKEGAAGQAAAGSSEDKKSQ